MGPTPLELDLTDKTQPPADDPARAPLGWTWDRNARVWRPKKARGRGGWISRNAKADFTDPSPAAAPDDMGPFERDVAGDDPPPAYATRPAPKAPKAPPPKVTAKTKAEMSAACGLVGMIILPPLTRKDPYCGAALTDNLQPVVDAVVPILCRSERVVRLFTDEGSDWLLYVKLGVALTPVATAVFQHHILKTVEIQQDKDTGDLYAVSTAPADLETEYAT